MELGEILRDRRKATGRTIASVAVDAGLSVPYIANLENGRGNPTVSALDKLATALGARLEVRIADEPVPEPRSVGAELLAAASRSSAERAGRERAGSDRSRSDEVIRRLAAGQGRSRGAVRADLVRTLDALAALLSRTPDQADLDRLLDLLLLAENQASTHHDRP